jgi:hypothetical protein
LIGDSRFAALTCKRLRAPAQVCDAFELTCGFRGRCVGRRILAQRHAASWEDANLWARDTSGIVLRCLADTVITFVYLVRHGTAEDYKAFRAYGEGQEKLLMLHLQDSHQASATLEGRSSQDIASALGGFAVEMMNIDLGSWSKSDTRRLASKIGMDRLYRLVYTPTSADVHGTWASLKTANLCYCRDPHSCCSRSA